MRPLLVGMANPYGGPPSNALIPDPPYCAGWNLCHKVMQLDEDEYLRRFDRVNLCHRDWKIKEARERANEIQSQMGTEHFGAKWSALVLCGAKVCSAFGVKFQPFIRLGDPVGALAVGPWIILPHPSGLSRAWNEPGAFERARAVLREAGVL